MKEISKPVVGVTIGDMNGIGPEIILKVFSDSRLLDICCPVIYGSLMALDYYKKNLHLPDLALNQIKDAEEIKRNKVNVIECLEEKVQVEPGHSTDEAGKLAYAALLKATEDVLSKKIDLIVTAPINKKNIRDFHKNFTGHTGFLSEKDGNEALMILCSEKMKIAMVTGHVALSDVKKNITVESVISKIESLHKCLIRDFGIRRPRIAVLGLNPHAGEEGILGTEEITIINPSIDQVKTKGILAAGPYPADGFFGSANYLNFDGILAMYHDQALIPFKTLNFENGVNFSASLNFIRTSPDHGTAYEIAGKGEASESSMRSAIYTACDIFRLHQEQIRATEKMEA